MLQTSQLLQSFVGRASVQSPTPVEFIPGQVFRGTVQKLFPDNLALVQIGGMPVMAKLEASLEAGQRAWLQVQPTSGMVTLKVLTDTERPQQAQSPTIDGLMKSLGILDSKESQGIVSALVKENAPITKEIVRSFETIAKTLSPTATTTEAFVLAMKRGLPLTKDVVGAIKAFLSPTQTLGTAMQAVAQELDLFLASTQSEQKGESAAISQQATAAVVKEPVSTGMQANLHQAAQQLKERLSVLTSLLNQVTGEDSAPSLSNDLLTPNRPAQAPSSSPSPSPSPSLPSHQQQQQLAINGQQELAQGSKDGLQGSLKGQIQQPLASQSGLTEQSGPLHLRHQSTVPSQDSYDSPSLDAAVSGPSFGEKENPIKELFRQLGMMHERQLLQQGLTGRGEAQHAETLENVKSLAMQIASSPSIHLSPGLREAADQLLQQVTGQQLMLIQPPNQALAQIVMQIPLRTENGEENAFIQVESKKKDSGQLDSDNCRLLFNLDMQQLGTTMVDVAIVNRIISVQVFNNMPWLEPLLAKSRGALAAEMRELGYQLSNLRFLPIPDGPKSINAADGRAARGTMLNEYKGMDIRV